MSNSDQIYSFISKEDFNEKTNYICPNAYSEYEKFAMSFAENFTNNGPNSFSPTMAVFSHLSKFVGVVTCRPAQDKDDLYQAMAEMLYFPMSISSELFIIATDVNINNDNDSNIKDAMTLSFVSPENCLIYTIPYSYDSNNQVTWHENQSFINKVATNQDSSPVGDLVELFFVFSHGNSTGPFSYDEVLKYFSANKFPYEIFNPQNMNDKNAIAIPFYR